MRLPNFGELDREQRAVYNLDPNGSFLVVGPPGSGKTSMAIWRARLLSGPELGQTVVLVTRNRMLAAAAAQLSLENGGQVVSTATMSSYASQHYQASFGRDIPEFGRGSYLYRWQQIQDEYAQADRAPGIDHLIVDEGQNLPPGFFVWARRFAATNMTVFADENQTTQGDGSSIQDFAAAGFNGVVPLLKNHRNSQEIVDLVGQFHVNRDLPLPASERARGAAVPTLMPIGNWPQLVQVVANRLRNAGESIGVIAYRQDDVRELTGLFRAALGDAARVDTYTSATVRGGEQAVRIRDRGVTILSGESAIGLEFDTLYLQDLDRSLPADTALKQRRLYMLMARARNTLVLVNGPTALGPRELASLPQPPVLVPYR